MTVLANATTNTPTTATRTPHEGFFPWLQRRLFGARAARLTEQRGRTHWLSYLLIIAQSIAVVLVFGHAEAGMLLSANVVIFGMAALSLVLLVISVVGADLAFIETVTRVGPLARNRQAAMLLEHLSYAGFVMGVEAATMGVVIYTLDSNPSALIDNRPFVPTSSWFLIGLVVMRVALFSWTALQLIIVRQKLPVLLSTLMTTGKEIIGGHVQQQFADLDVSNIRVRDMFGVYKDLAKPPRPVAGFWNWLLRGAIVSMAKAREAEEERQAGNVLTALEKVDMYKRYATSATSDPSLPALPVVSAPSIVKEIASAGRPRHPSWPGDSDDRGDSGETETVDPFATMPRPALGGVADAEWDDEDDDFDPDDDPDDPSDSGARSGRGSVGTRRNERRDKRLPYRPSGGRTGTRGELDGSERGSERRSERQRGKVKAKSATALRAAVRADVIQDRVRERMNALLDAEEQGGPEVTPYRLRAAVENLQTMRNDTARDMLTAERDRRRRRAELVDFPAEERVEREVTELGSALADLAQSDPRLAAMAGWNQ